MKIIHTADLHLASPFSYLPKEKRKIKNFQTYKKTRLMFI